MFQTSKKQSVQNRLGNSELLMLYPSVIEQNLGKLDIHPKRAGWILPCDHDCPFNKKINITYYVHQAQRGRRQLSWFVTALTEVYYMYTMDMSKLVLILKPLVLVLDKTSYKPLIGGPNTVMS